MNRPYARSEPAPPTLVLFSLGPRSRAEADSVARQLGAARVEVRDLRAACKALLAERPMLLVASTALKVWDREIVEEHATRASVPVRWIAPDDWKVIDQHVRAWVQGARRPGRS